MKMFNGLALALAIAPFLWAAPAGANDSAVIKRECASQLKMPPKACDCIAERAAAELNEGQRAFFLARVLGQRDEAAKLQSELSIAEQTQVGSFMSETPRACAGG